LRDVSVKLESFARLNSLREELGGGVVGVERKNKEKILSGKTYPR